MTLNDEIKILDEKLKKMNMPFDKGLPILQDLVWEIADRYNTTGPEVLKAYFEWKSTEIKKKINQMRFEYVHTQIESL